MLLWLVWTVLACGDACHQDAAGRGRARSKAKKPARKRSRSRSAASVPCASQEPGALAKGRAAASRQLAGHRSDAAAVGLVVVGVLCALGLWTDLAGPVGEALADGTGAVLGRARVAIPVACIAFAVVLLWPRRAASDPTTTSTPPPSPPSRARAAHVRIAIGALLLLIADVAILHLAYGQPSLDGSLDALRDAGGVLGGVFAVPVTAADRRGRRRRDLRGVALLGVLLALGLSIRSVAAAAGSGAAAAVKLARAGLGVEPIGAGAELEPRPEPFPRPRARGRATELEPEPEPEPVPVVAHEERVEIELPTVTEPERADGDRPRRRRAARTGDWKLPPLTLLEAGERQARRPRARRGRRPRPRGHARAARCGRAPHRHDRSVRRSRSTRSTSVPA